MAVTKPKPAPGRRSQAGAPKPSAKEVTIAQPGRFVLEGCTEVEVREVVAAGPGLPARPPGLPEQAWAWFDGEAIAWPLTLRARRSGDRMRPRGGRGSRKLSDLLIDAKIPRAERDHQPVLTAADGEVLYVPRLRPSQMGAPTKMTRRLVAIAAVPMSGAPDSSGVFTGP